MMTNRKLLAVTGLIVALSLAGCWDDDDDVQVPTSTEVPDSAGVGTAAFVAYLLTLSTSDESSEPLTIKDTFAVPDDESAEPTPLV